MNMNPNEIKKALECCMDEMGCKKGCPCFDPKSKSSHCTAVGDNGLEKLALAYINQLEEKIDDLERDTIPKLQWSLKRANECGIKTDKENQQLKAEVERLKAEQEMADGYAEALEERAKSEAIKEFAERLKEEGRKYCGEITYEDIDNLVKEMVGDEE